MLIFVRKGKTQVIQGGHKYNKCSRQLEEGLQRFQCANWRNCKGKVFVNLSVEAEGGFQGFVYNAHSSSCKNAKAASRAAEAAKTPPDMTNDPEANEIPSITSKVKKRGHRASILGNSPICHQTSKVNINKRKYRTSPVKKASIPRNSQNSHRTPRNNSNVSRQSFADANVELVENASQHSGIEHLSEEEISEVWLSSDEEPQEFGEQEALDQPENENGIVAERDRLKADLEKTREDKNGIVAERDRLKADLEKTREDKNGIVAERDRLKADLEKTREDKNGIVAERDRLKADLEKTREDKNGIVAERDRLKTELAKANETVRISMEKSAELGLKLKVQVDKCNEYIAEIVKLKQDSGGDTDQLKSNLVTCQAQLEHCRAELEKTREDKNDIVAERDRLKADLTKANETVRISVEKSAELGLKLKVQVEKCNEYIAEIVKLKQDSGGNIDQLKSDLDTCRVQLQEAQDDMRRVTEEKNQLKVELKTASDNSKTATERINELDLKLKVAREKHTAEIDKLKEDLANSLQLNADLEQAKLSMADLTVKNDNLAAECETVSKLYKESRTIIYNQAMNCNTHKSQIADLEAENTKLKEEKENLKQECEGGNIEQLKSDLDTSRVQLQKAQDDMSRVAKERNQLKAELESASEKILELEFGLEMLQKKYDGQTENYNKMKKQYEERGWDWKFDK